MSDLEFLVPRHTFVTYLIRGWGHPAIAALDNILSDGFWFKKAPVDWAAWALAYYGDPED